MSGVKRATRVAERIREELAAILRELSDPRVQGVIVSRVDVSDDLGNAKIYVRQPLGADDRARTRLLRGLDAAAGRIRSEVSRAVGLRRAPAVKFFYDESPEAHARVEELLREVRDSEKKG